MALRVGFIGAGFIATFHSKMLRGSGVDFVRAGVYDTDRARAESFTEAAGGVVADGVEEVLAGCDVVYLCTWTAGRPELIDAVVEAGVAVFVEKPLGVDLDAARHVAEALERSGVVHQVGLVLRHSPAFALAEDLLSDGELVGETMAVVFRDDQLFPVGQPYASEWRGDPDRAGSGVLLEHSIHDVDLLDRLVGPIESVSAVQANFGGRRGIEDLVQATFMLPGGATASLTTLWHDNAARGALRLLEVHGTRGLVTVEGDWFGPVTLETPARTERWEGERLLEECARRGLRTPNPDADFLAAVRDGVGAHPDAAVALRAHELCAATYRSAADNGTWVSIRP